jgi:hypothetical protein
MAAACVKQEEHSSTLGAAVELLCAGGAQQYIGSGSGVAVCRWSTAVHWKRQWSCCVQVEHNNTLAAACGLLCL